MVMIELKDICKSFGDHVNNLGLIEPSVRHG